MTEIKIKDLRGVGDVELNLDDTKRVFVFFGSNGVGKTKTLESIFIGLVATNSEFDITPKYGSFERLFREYIDFLNKIHLLFDTEYVSTDTLQINPERKSFAIAYLGANQRGVFNHHSGYYNKQVGNFNQRKSDYLQRFESSLYTVDGMKDLGMSESLNEWFVLRAQSVNPYQREEDNRKIEIDTVLNALNILDNRIEKTLKIDGDGNVFLTVEGQERELSELSSGFISVVKIIQSIISAYSAFTNATDLLNVKGVVLIDEIESHLHIEWQTKIVPTLKNLFPNTTFYIATHSPLVLSQLAEGEAYLLKRDADGVVRSQEINSPNTRLLENVLQDAFDVDLNQLKRENMEHIDQTKAKQKLLALLNK